MKGRIASEVRADALIRRRSRRGRTGCAISTRFRQIFRCNPGEGLVWAWRAMAGDELGARSRDPCDDFDISAMFALSELLVASMRLPASCQTVRCGGSSSSGRTRPARSLRRRRRPGAAATIVAPAFVWITAEARRAYAETEDPERRERLFRTFGARRANDG